MATPAMTTKPRATAPAARMDPHTARRGMFVLEDGRNVVFTFFLLVFLFALWGFCNGMIDVMDKHFQEELHLNLAQSAWVQFAHYLGYFLMAIPAGWLAIKLGYKGGIIAGLLMVAAGGFWFIPASHIAQFWAFLLGVCIIAAGLTFLETIANPYTTVLGPPQYAATRINLAQSINGIGLLLGPIAGGAFFYSKNAAGISTGSERLWIPYAFIAVIVVILAIVFFFAPMPDIEMEDDYHVDESTPDTRRSIWSHPHFWMAVLAQFLYVAAQAGIFSFFINYMTSQVPPIPSSWHPPDAPASGFFAGWFETHRNGALGFSNKAASNLASLGFLCFLIGRFTGSAILKKFTPYKVLGWYSAAAVALCLLIFAKLGWVSVACVFLTYFFMSIMFPTIFALGIFGLGQSAQESVVVHRHGHHGWRGVAESNGRGGRSLRSLARLYRADALLRLRGLLWVHVAAAEQGRGHSHCFNFRRTLMNASFDLNHAKLAADPRFAGIAHELSALSPINSRDSFNRYCREACRLWNEGFPNGIGETEQFAELLYRIEHANDGVIRTGLGRRRHHPARTSTGGEISRRAQRRISRARDARAEGRAPRDPRGRRSCFMAST